MVSHFIVEVIPSQQRHVLHIAGVPFYCQSEIEHFIRHVTDCLVGSRVNPLTCQGISHKSLARVYVPHKAHHSLRGLHNARESIHILHILGHCSCIAIAYGQVIGRQVYCRKHKLHIDVSRHVAGAVYQLYVEWQGCHFVAVAIGVYCIRQVAVELHLQPSGTQPVRVAHHMDLTVVVVAVHRFAAYAGGRIGVGRRGSPEPGHPVAAGPHYRTVLRIPQLQQKVKIRFVVDSCHVLYVIQK